VKIGSPFKYITMSVSMDPKSWTVDDSQATTAGAFEEHLGRPSIWPEDELDAGGGDGGADAVRFVADDD
jgi:hypothetical protein